MFAFFFIATSHNLHNLTVIIINIRIIKFYFKWTSDA